MFTGIVQDKAEIVAVEKRPGMTRLSIRTAIDLGRADIGASICCSGCCLTVVEKDGDVFVADVSLETLDKTNIGDWQPGTRINIEPSLRLGDELGGHIVSGHVDGIARLDSVVADGDSYRLTLTAPSHLSAFIAPKGSVTLDGISLTVNEVDGHSFTVNIIPHTWEVTNIGQYGPGGRLNLEIDVIARYVARMIEAKAA